MYRSIPRIPSVSSTSGQRDESHSPSHPEDIFRIRLPVRSIRVLTPISPSETTRRLLSPFSRADRHACLRLTATAIKGANVPATSVKRLDICKSCRRNTRFMQKKLPVTKQAMNLAAVLSCANFPPSRIHGSARVTPKYAADTPMI